MSRILYFFEGFDKKYKESLMSDADRYAAWKQNARIVDMYHV